MIDLREIRLGNWFHHNENWCYRRDQGSFGVSEPDGEFDFQFEESDWYAWAESTLSERDISPIPITPEWLEKLGFTGNCPYWSLADFTISAIGNSLFFVSKGNSTPVDGTVIKYVHQLQNLYFALAHKELGE